MLVFTGGIKKAQPNARICAENQILQCQSRDYKNKYKLISVK